MMAISIVASLHATPGSEGGTTSAIDTTGATALLVHVSWYIGGSASISDSKSNSFGTPVVSEDGATSGVASDWYLVASPTVGSGHTFTITGATSYGTITVYAISGEAASPLDQTNHAEGGSGTEQAAGSVTPTEDNEIIVTGVGSGANGEDSVSSPFSTPDYTPTTGGVNFAGGAAYSIQTTATTRNPTWSGEGIGRSATVATFKAAAVAVGSVLRRRSSIRTLTRM